MKFILPCEKYKQRAVEFIQEFRGYSSDMNGTGGLEAEFYSETFGEVIQRYSIIV